MKFIKIMFIMIFLLSFVKNSMIIVGTNLEIIFDILIYFLVLVISFFEFKKFNINKSAITGNHLFLIIISGIFLLYLDKGHLQFFTIMIFVFLVRVYDSMDFLIPIAKIYTIVLFFILILHLSGMYQFDVIHTNLIKDPVIRLGFRTSNTFGIYCLNSLIIFYVFRNKKWFWFSSLILVLSSFYTQSRTSLLALILIIFFSIFKWEKIPKRFSSNIFSMVSFLIWLLGFVSIFYAEQIMHQTILNGLTLDELFSLRFTINYSHLSNFTPLQSFFGGVSEILDSHYLFFVSFFGIFFTLLIFSSLIKGFYILNRSHSHNLSIIVTVILAIGLVEMPLSPFLFTGVLFFLILLYPSWFNSKTINKSLYI